MTTTLLISAADKQRLQTILNDSISQPRTTPEQQEFLGTLLADVRTTADESELHLRVGLDDEVSLVSPSDSRDDYSLQVVMPSDMDIDQDRISIFQPVSRAIIGRSCGELVCWETPGGTREMKILAVRKAVLHIPV